MMKQKSIIKQKGFTLLELLVVITLLAILAVGGLVAYDGVTDNAEASAAAYNAGTLDRAVRQYRAVTSAYPDQWDNLANPDNGIAVGSADASGAASTDNDQFLPEATRQVFGSFNLAATTSGFQAAFLDIVEDVWGMEELQSVAVAYDGTVAPGKFHNEGTGFSIETEWGDIGTGGLVAAGEIAHISILPSTNGASATTACTVGGQNASTSFNGDGPSLAKAERQNAINDALGIERCHFVVALGFGGDAASSTSRASVQIPAAPTYTSQDVNPAQNYGRYIGLFHVARTDSGATQTTITEADFFPRPKLIGFVDTEGKPVDVNIAASREPS
jgi:prepilin-type N-terminal cleavage/methylation domain-containing protein